VKRLFIVAAAACVACAKADTPAADSVAAVSSAPAAAALGGCVIADSAIGKLELGMTVTEAKASWPEATFSRTSDGEGVALIDVSVGSDQMIVAYAGEDDAESPVDSTKPMKQLETFSDKCVTANGVHPGMLVSDAEKIIGKTRSVATSEIESREYIEFEKQPVWMTIRLGPESKLLSIAIATR
jgi:hypothetical protein